MDPEEYRLDIERKILKIIEEKLINGQMDASRAREIARYILNVLPPPMTLDEIYKIAPTLDDHFSELAAVVIPISNEYNEKVKQIVVGHVKKLMDSGKIPEALDILKKANNNQIKINL